MLENFTPRLFQTGFRLQSASKISVGQEWLKSGENQQKIPPALLSAQVLKGQTTENQTMLYS